ncbi:hypothetical protein ABID22_003634 [Pontibacter aydingkolensis]|uniref:Uncharacterized protein n=1 Tax=Pontibacter aydingkolensis TaxID=1911536 RepID=A0ABS7CYM1_9BACT|nr:hypothetical protein [Pontibacter aydingkolensis]MBW7468913.1 hypothetical protein [Pontibacter aydingkolensis]
MSIQKAIVKVLYLVYVSAVSGFGLGWPYQMWFILAVQLWYAVFRGCFDFIVGSEKEILRVLARLLPEILLDVPFEWHSSAMARKRDEARFRKINFAA